MKMLRKIDKPITSCNVCPNCDWDEDYGYYRCSEIGDPIGNDEDIEKVYDGCHLPDAGVKVGITIMMVKDSKVLLGERGEDCQTARNLYAYPGGRMDYGDTPEQSAVREVLEETGMIIEEKDLEFLRICPEYFPEDNRHYVSLVFLCKKFKGEPELKEPDKCKGWEWFSPDELPENTFWAVRESIEMFRDKI